LIPGDGAVAGGVGGLFLFVIGYGWVGCLCVFIGTCILLVSAGGVGLILL